MASRNETTIFAKAKQRASKGRARDRVEAAQRRVDADRTDRSRSRAGLERAQRELHVVESDLHARGLIE